ncbi:ankyrin repeat domain-containing protein [Massilia sp. BJB1822]|uniref:ankyrin repeat domain-containing protein n=1 Tax=Massilia sp. BJB1822 TaxID=2744470 RepID=UPI0015942CEF|nr:ankyrin repeat domain-containing protein [Massilia sp. BJB1822]NVE01799.1 ankyrin repeat domain-containing protein [Massilia sp. BJB1822]
MHSPKCLKTLLPPALSALAATFLILPVQAADNPTPSQRLATMGLEATPARLVQFAAQGDANVVALLLQAGVGVNAAEPLRQVTALHNAAAQGHVSLMKKLLEQGANVNAADWYGTTPLIAAAYFGQTEAVRLLLQQGATVNAVSKQGETALTAAVYSGKEALLDMLLAQGASPALPAAGMQPLAIAQRAGRSNMAAALQKSAGGAK